MGVSWEIETLESGLRVVTTPVPTAQSVSVNVFVGVGSRAEDSRTNGLSHYLEHMMFKGTEQRATAIDIAEAIEGAGGVITDWQGRPLGPESDGRVLAAGDTRVHEAARRILDP